MNTAALLSEEIDDELEPGVGAGDPGHDPAEGGDQDSEAEVRIASRFGWVPKDQWRGKPEEHLSAGQFLERYPAQVNGLKDQVRRLGRVVDKVAEDAKRRGREEAQAEFDAAVEAGDKDAAAEASRKITAAEQPSSEIDDWVSKNPWFKANSAARGLACAISEDLSKRGASVSEQLEAAEQEVRARYPELFSTGERTVPTTPTARKPAPATQPGARTQTAQRPAKDSFESLPKPAQAAYAKHFAKQMTKDEYAKTYLAEQQ